MVNARAKSLENEMKICYRNTDLDLVSAVPLDPLFQRLEALGLVRIANHQDPDGNWFAAFEFIGADEKELVGSAETTAVGILTVLEQLEGSEKDLFDQCLVREFNTAYDFGSEPNGFNDAISAETVSRMAKVNAAMRVTLYTDE